MALRQYKNPLGRFETILFTYLKINTYSKHIILVQFNEFLNTSHDFLKRYVWFDANKDNLNFLTDI